MLCLPRGRTRGTQAPWPGRMRSTPSELLARPPYRCAGVLACGAVACSHITACFGLFSIQVASAGLGPQLLTVSLPHLRLSLPLLRPSPRSRIELLWLGQLSGGTCRPRAAGAHRQPPTLPPASVCLVSGDPCSPGRTQTQLPTIHLPPLRLSLSLLRPSSRSRIELLWFG
jgi:hypothetical protein